MGMYRLVRDGKPVFYEMMTLVEEKASLTLRLKHFNPDLTGWEAKDQTIDFPLVAVSNEIVHFDGMSRAVDDVRGPVIHPMSAKHQYVSSGWMSW